MVLLRRLYGRLKLRINEAKSPVADALAQEREFLGFAFYAFKREVRCRVASKPLRDFQLQVRRLIRRSGAKHRGCDRAAARLSARLEGLLQAGTSITVWRELDEWLRHRLRAMQLKQWRSGSTIYRALHALGATQTAAHTVAANSRRWWRNSAGALTAC